MRSNNHDKYLLAQYIQVPGDPKRTSEPGYINDLENCRFNEKVVFLVGLKKNSMQDYNIILNIDKQEVVKNNIGPSKEWEPIWNYFLQNYPHHIRKFLLDR